MFTSLVALSSGAAIAAPSGNPGTYITEPSPPAAPGPSRVADVPVPLGGIELTGFSRWEQQHGHPVGDAGSRGRRAAAEILTVTEEFATEADVELFCAWADALPGDETGCRAQYTSLFFGATVEATYEQLAAQASDGATPFPVAAELQIAEAPAGSTHSTQGLVWEGLWGLDRIDNAGTDFQYSYPKEAGSGVTVFVVDSGVRCSHSDFGGRCRQGYTWKSAHGHDDNDGHGTHCAGTVAGSRFGVAKKANVVSVKVCETCEKEGCPAGWKSSAICRGSLNGLEYVARYADSHRGEKIVVSYSISGWSGKEQSLINKGVVFVQAAGNDDESADAAGQPGQQAIAGKLVVGAQDVFGYKASFSNWGKNVNVWAPGVDIMSAGHASDSATKTLQGTSMACPHVAGVAALLLSSTPSLAGNPAAVQNKIIALSKSNAVAGNLHGGPNKLVSLPKACSTRNTVCASVWFTAGWTCGHCCDGHKITTKRQWWGGSLPHQGVCR